MRAADITAEQVYRNGHNVPSVNVAARMAHVLGVTLDDLLSEAGV